MISFKPISTYRILFKHQILVLLIVDCVCLELPWVFVFGLNNTSTTSLCVLTSEKKEDCAVCVVLILE